MFSYSLLQVLLASSTLGFAVPRATTSSSNCTNVQTRLEWSNLTDTQKLGYIDAVKCLYKKPNGTALAGAVNRYEDLTAVHQHEADYIHLVGQYLPWHRYFLHVYEYLLQSECDYTGPTPWWYEQRDAGHFLDSPLMDNTTGFGGNGTGANGCLESGPFANTTLHVGPQTDNTNHCLSRLVNNTNSLYTNSTWTAYCDSQETYYDFWQCNFLYQHGGGHIGLGGNGGFSNGTLGTMADVAASPGDPVSIESFENRYMSPTY